MSMGEENFAGSKYSGCIHDAKILNKIKNTVEAESNRYPSQDLWGLKPQRYTSPTHVSISCLIIYFYNVVTKIKKKEILPTGN